MEDGDLDTILRLEREKEKQALAEDEATEVIQMLLCTSNHRIVKDADDPTNLLVVTVAKTIVITWQAV